MIGLKLDEKEYSKSIAERLVRIFEMKWNEIADSLFNHIHEKGCNYDPVFTDSHFEAMALYYQTCKGICIIAEIEFSIPHLEEIAFTTYARLGDRSYLRGDALAQKL